MRIVPERGTATRIVALLGLLAAGPLVANMLAPTLSPGSGLVHFFSPFVFGLVMVGGIFLWVGLGVVTVLSGGLIRMASGRRTGVKIEAGQRLVPPGYIGFAVLGGVAGAALGVAGAAFSDGALVTSLGGWLALGLAYGACLWLAAHQGYLPFPDDD